MKQVAGRASGGMGLVKVNGEEILELWIGIWGRCVCRTVMVCSYCHVG